MLNIFYIDETDINNRNNTIEVNGSQFISHILHDYYPPHLLFGFNYDAT